MGVCILCFVDVNDAHLIVAVQHPQYKIWEMQEVTMAGEVVKTLTKTSLINSGVRGIITYTMRFES